MPLPSTSRAYQTLVHEIAALYTQTRSSVVRMYWEIGRRIVEVEQAGEERAEYGEQLKMGTVLNPGRRTGEPSLLCFHPLARAAHLWYG